MIDITGIDLVKFAQKVYSLSVPRGFGWMNPRLSEDLTDAEAKALVRPEGHLALSMDYVRWRGCKMQVFREGDKLLIRDSWYDHTDSELEDLLAAFGMAQRLGGVRPEHGISCDCAACCMKRGSSA